MTGSNARTAALAAAAKTVTKVTGQTITLEIVAQAVGG